MNKPQTSIFAKAYNPFYQALGILSVGILVTGLAKLVNTLGILEIGNKFPWMCAAAFLLFFAMFNSISSLSAEDINKYWGKSMISFLLLALTSGFGAYFLSSVSINDAGSYRWIFIVLTFGYLTFLSIIGLMKTIVDFAEKEVWKSPKRKQRKRRF